MLPMLAGYPLGYIAYCEALHYMLGFSAGLLAFLPTQTICSKVWGGGRTYLSSYAAALFFSSLLHWIADVQGWGF